MVQPLGVTKFVDRGSQSAGPWRGTEILPRPGVHTAVPVHRTCVESHRVIAVVVSSNPEEIATVRVGDSYFGVTSLDFCKLGVVGR